MSMPGDELGRWRHGHGFGQDTRRPGESKTLIVILITAAMMAVEIVAGIAFGSMALLADGLHMASHAAALSVNAFAYVYARRHAHDTRFSFGTGKVNTLGGFTGAVLLACFAALMAYESVDRLVVPVPIAFNQAIWVAVIGLIVNGISVLILEHRPASVGAADEHDHAESHRRHGDHGHHHHDHNLASAYLHVLADALTSLLAIFALLAAKYFGLNWMDPLMGVVGSVLVARWSFGLLTSTSKVLLDRAAPDDLLTSIRSSLAGEHDAIADLHVWPVGPEIYSAIVSIVSTAPRQPQAYRALLPADRRLVHVTIEVHDRNV